MAGKRAERTDLDFRTEFAALPLVEPVYFIFALRRGVWSGVGLLSRYLWLIYLIQSTPDNSNLSLTRTKIDWIIIRFWETAHLPLP